MKRAVIRTRPFTTEAPLLTLNRETGELIIEGDFDIVEEDLNIYVQVSFDINEVKYGSGSKLYTYIDPWGDLQVGDLVDVPTQHADHNVVIVRRLGDGYKGRAHASVLGRYGIVSLAPELPAQKLSDGSGVFFGFGREPRGYWE